MDYTYQIVKNSETGRFSLSFNGVEIAEGLDMDEAAIMLETLIRRD